MSYRTICFGTDGSATANVARDAAIDLAFRLDAKVVAVSAFDPPKSTADRARSVAEEAVEAAATRDVQAVARWQRGEPADVVLEVAEREHADLIVVGNVGMGQATRFRLGSVPDRVAHYAPCDVLIIATRQATASGPPDARRPYQRILAATDGSPTANEAARKAFELGMVHGATVELVHVGDPVVGQIRLETTSRARPDGVDVQLVALEGEPAEAITDYAEEAGADLIVVGNKGMSGARRFLLGSVPNRVAHFSPTDVLIARTVDLSVFDIQPDHGAVLEMDGRNMAVYRDAEGLIHSVSARCTHMGCSVGWNDGDKTWDCPCHGSRYDRLGHVIRGPAKADLEGAPAREEEPEAEHAPAPAVASERKKSPDTYVVVGASLAGGSAVVRLRQDGFDGRVILIGAENHYPYERPPLSKAFLRGEVAFEEALLQPVSFYRDNDVEVRFATRATAVDLGSKTVTLHDGEELRWDGLLLATGARNRRLPIPGLDLPGVYDLRSVHDAERIRAEMEPGKRVVIGGMGFIGSEVAASLRRSGLEVTAIDGGKVPLGRVLGEDIGAVLADVHRENGVTLYFDDRVDSFEGADRVHTVVTGTGLRLDCDFAVVGLGVEPNVELGAEAGLKVDNGIVVDQFCKTSAEGVYAAGDMANHFHPVFGRSIRVEHWQNAIRQGSAAGANMMGRAEPYADIPWFWSDQYDVNLQYAGFHTEWDELVVRGSLKDRSFVAFYVKDGTVQAVLAMNQGHTITEAMELIKRRAPVDPKALRDEDVALASLASP
jgi:3-phenylpropionate/trans-cinnamate dioxygenase ferredoxin reductase component